MLPVCSCAHDDRCGVVVTVMIATVLSLWVAFGDNKIRGIPTEDSEGFMLQCLFPLLRGWEADF